MCHAACRFVQVNMNVKVQPVQFKILIALHLCSQFFTTIMKKAKHNSMKNTKKTKLLGNCRTKSWTTHGQCSSKDKDEVLLAPSTPPSSPTP